MNNSELTVADVHAAVKDMMLKIITESHAQPIPWSDRPIFAPKAVIAAYEKIRSDKNYLGHPLVAVTVCPMPRNS